MTKREPFAQFEDYHEGYELSGMLLGGVCFIELPMGAPGDIEIVDKTNAAHDKAVREAVEEFRGRVVEVVIKNVTRRIDDSRVPAKVGQDIYEEILSLPTEPEVK